MCVCVCVPLCVRAIARARALAHIPECLFVFPPRALGSEEAISQQPSIEQVRRQIGVRCLDLLRLPGPKEAPPGACAISWRHVTLGAQRWNGQRLVQHPVSLVKPCRSLPALPARFNHTGTHTHTHTHTLANTHTHSHTRTHTHLHAHARTHTRMHARAHASTHTLANTHTHRHTHIHTYTLDR